MKVKITLLGLLVTNGMILPTYASPDGERFVLEKEEKWSMKKETDSEEKEEDGEAAVVNIGGDVVMMPSAVYKEDQWEIHNDVKAILGFKTTIPEALYDQEAAIQVKIGLEREHIKFKEAKAIIARYVTIGYGGSIFEFAKANPALLVSPVANVLQLKFEHTFDEGFKLGYAIESPLELKLGLFDKTYAAPQDEQKKKGGEAVKSVVNQIDNIKEDTKRAFKVKNNIPAFGLSLGWVPDRVHVVLNLLGRVSDYTHAIDPNTPPKDLTTKRQFTYGTHLGIQYKAVPKKVTLAGQGCFVSGLGDYISGLGSIQADEKRKEMSAVYYTDVQKDSLTKIDAWGAGGTVEFCATPEWTLSVAGSYLGALKDEQKPGSAFSYAWKILPKLAYNLNKHLSFSVGHAVGKEEKVDKAQSEGLANKTSGSIQFHF